MIKQAHQEYGTVKIIDIGGTKSYWNILSNQVFEEYDIQITIVNIPEISIPKDQGRYHFVSGDGRNLSNFNDGSFHIIHSNSVIEHVGDWESMTSFAKEIKRLAPMHFVQTPNYWFPLEPHCMTPFFHLLPKPIRLWLVLHFQLGNWTKATTINEAVRLVESARLLCKPILKELFQESEIVTERVLGLSKSFVAIKKC